MLKIMYTPNSIALDVAKNFRNARKKMKITIKELSERSGVSYSSIRRFETKGEISFVSLIKIASILNMESQIANLFSEAMPTSIEEVLATNR